MIQVVAEIAGFIRVPGMCFTILQRERDMMILYDCRSEQLRALPV